MPLDDELLTVRFRQIETVVSPKLRLAPTAKQSGYEIQPIMRRCFTPDSSYLELRAGCLGVGEDGPDAVADGAVRRRRGAG